MNALGNMLHPLLHNMGPNLEFLQMIKILFTNFSILGEGFRYMGQFSPLSIWWAGTE